MSSRPKQNLAISNRFPLFVSALAAFLLAASACSAGETTKTLAEGVTLRQIIRNEGTEPQVINVLKIDTRNPGVKVESALAGGAVMADDPTQGRETISRLTARTDALAAVNADYFPYTGDPLGVAITNGDLVSEPFQGRAVLGISRGGWYLFDRLGFTGQVTSANGTMTKLHGVNRLRGPNEMICYTPAYNGTTPARNDCVNAVLTGVAMPLPPNKPVEAVVKEIIPGPGVAVPADGYVLSGNGIAAAFITNNLRPGEKVTLSLKLLSAMGKNWDPVVQAIGGGPWLVMGGRVSIDWAAEKFSSSIGLGRHPRTAVGMTAAKELLLVTVDGRQWISKGMTLQELAQLMVSLGAMTAINLDGGGSTSMSIKGLVVNSPCEGTERAVANALVVKTTEAPRTDPEIAFCVPQLTAQVGVGQKLALVDTSTNQPLPAAKASSVIWGTKGGKGFVNQTGFFVPMRVGTGSVSALLGDKRAEMQVTVTLGAPATLTVAIKADPTGAVDRGLVEAKLTDVAGNPIPLKQASITVVGGTADFADVTTDEKGVASFSVTWDAAGDPAVRSVTVTVGGLTPVSAKPKALPVRTPEAGEKTEPPPANGQPPT